MVTLITVAALVVLSAAYIINGRIPRERDDNYEQEVRDA